MSEARQDGGADQADASAAETPETIESQVPALGGGDDPGAGEAPTWREDWRETLAGGDEKRLKELGRFATPEAFAKSGFEARDRIARGRAATPEPPEGASDAELAQWRKQAGIPEAPEGYQIAFPAEMKPSDADKAELGQFLKFMHERHVAPGAAKAAFEFYMTARAEGQTKAEEAIDEQIQQNVADLRRTFPGKEYVRNLGKNGEGGLANDYLRQHFSGPDGNAALREVLNARVSSGVPLALYAPFIKSVVNMARDVASEDALIGGDGAGGGQSLDEEYKTLVAVERPSDAQRQRMTQIQEARIGREQRQGRSRAA